MRRARTPIAVLAALLAVLAATLLVSAGSSAAPTKSQALFRKLLLADEHTTSAIKRLLERDGGFVSPEVEFTDLTGDGRSDAIVLVENGGAAGAVALYVFSTDGEAADSDLRAVYRSQRLYRANAAVADGGIVLTVPRYARGDDVCCPTKLARRTYVWSAGAKTLRLRSSDELDAQTG